MIKPVESFLPATFLERGVAVPFTTPQLNGARARPGERRPLELIIPNPSGGRGVYILPLEGIHDFCTLTINDRRLADGITKRSCPIAWCRSVELLDGSDRHVRLR
jgi:hypothetical protein